MSAFYAFLYPLGLLLITFIGLGTARRTGRTGRTGLTGAERSAGAPATPGAPGPKPGTRLRRGPLGTLRPAWRFAVIAGAGLTVAFGVLAALGPVAMAVQSLDDAVYRTTVDHQLGEWMSVQKVITDVGNSWLARGTCVGAALFLSLLWRRHRWLPVTAMLIMLVASHYLVLGLHAVADRPAPPNSGGTYPSGGNVRVIAIYGLVAYFYLVTLRPGRRVRVLAWTILALLAYTEAYSRTYLAVHWLTDVLAGLVFGGLLLAALTLACDAVLGGVDPAAGTSDADKSDAGNSDADSPEAGVNAARPGAAPETAGTATPSGHRPG